MERFSLKPSDCSLNQRKLLMGIMLKKRNIQDTDGKFQSLSQHYATCWVCYNDTMTQMK